MKYFFILLSFLFLNSPAHSQKFKPLFNKKDLTGWTVHGTEKWYVENGELVCESGPDQAYGYLTTDKHYKNFILELDFKLEANGNSGVFIRSSVEGTTVKGWQVEVAPPGHHSGGIYESYGRGWLIKPSPEGEKALQADGWNHMKIEAKGNAVTTWLNGKQMVYLEDEKIGQGEGSVALQIHSGGGIKVRWRDIRIKVLK